ncbi:UNVERIFIED_CONTAM: hypothetical protein GTU68_019751 [Idotea baltica]|nr:hypothetical protein [Idotea baltica]
MKIGYARVSRKDQNLDRQIDALTSAGCEKIFQEKVSGAKADRRELQMLLRQIRKGDTVVVSKLVRFGRSLKDLITNVNLVQEKGADFVSLTENIDTTTPSGKFMFHMMGAFAEFERDLIIERTTDGLASARARAGRGRPKGSPAAKQKASIASALYKEGRLSVSEICSQIGISKPTCYKYESRSSIDRI